jgi:palmitoyltransferase
MLTQADRNRIAVNLWTARITPVVLAGVVVYTTYVLVALLCGTSNCRRQEAVCFANFNVVNYLLIKHNDKAAAVPILAIYFLLFILMTVSFLRLVHIIVIDPPYAPLGPAAIHDRQRYNERERARPNDNGIAMGEYNPRKSLGGASPEATGSDNDPDSPSLELFYTKDVFVCDVDGRPIWCSECCNWYVDLNSFFWFGSLSAVSD